MVRPDSFITFLGPTGLGLVARVKARGLVGAADQEGRGGGGEGGVVLY